MHHGVTFNFGSAKVCSPAIFKTSFSYDKDIWIAATDYRMHNCSFPIDSYSPINKFYSFIIFSLLINTVILLLNCLGLILLFSLLKHYITDTALKVSRSLCCFTTSLSHCVENCFPRLWGTGISDAILIPFFYCWSYKFCV